MKNTHNKENFTNQLLAWYQANARVLPWREDISPYRVWVSEIMLQQTRVEAVKPYFERFIEALPSLRDLANASDDQLSKLWEGLGYYNRVRNMKKCAITCMEKYDGKLPESYLELLTLSGIGSYSAGAIASIAYGEQVSAVDGNVLRVFSRVLLSEDDILKEKTKKKFQTIVQAYIPKNYSSEFNQALMELGALICVPNSAPRCNICPVASECLGYIKGQAHRLPNKTSKKARHIEKKTVCVIVCNQEVLLYQRPVSGLLAGLYQFKIIDEAITKKDIEEYLPSFTIKRCKKLENAKHIFTHVEWYMKGFLIEVETKSEEGIWCSFTELEKTYAMPTALQVYKEELKKYMEKKG
ncbi:MAG: A/G-specific adenine glycosylase [Longicatena sp.]